MKYQYAICIGIPMRREEMQHVPHGRAGLEVQRVYGEVARVSIELAEHIRAMGWPAHAYGDPRSTGLLQIPLAIRAGLGQLGKHGSMISEEYGSNFRLSSVATDMPLTLDGPVDIGWMIYVWAADVVPSIARPMLFSMRSSGYAENTVGTWISINVCLISLRLLDAQSVLKFVPGRSRGAVRNCRKCCWPNAIKQERNDRISSCPNDEYLRNDIS